MIPADLSNTETPERAAATAPAEAAPLEAHARILAATTWEFAPILRDCRAALVLRIQAGEFAGADHADLARVWAASLKPDSKIGERKWARAMALAHLEYALEKDDLDIELWIMRARLWAAVGERELAESDFDSARELGGENVNSWLDQADCFERLLQWDAAYAAYASALRAGAQSGNWAFDSATCLEKAALEKMSEFRRRAWLDAGIENAPDNADLFLARAQLMRYKDPTEATIDYERAIEIRPDDPAIYEARARSGLSYYHPVIIADYETAARLRVRSGEIARDVSALTTRAKTLKKGGTSRTNSSFLHAIAFYNLAIELATDSHSLYLARATLRVKLRTHRGDNPDLLDAADEDWIRALALKSNLSNARRLLVEDLTISARCETAHEQLETLIALRQQLRARGLADEAIAIIVDEMQAQWAQDDAI